MKTGSDTAAVNNSAPSPAGLARWTGIEVGLGRPAIDIRSVLSHFDIGYEIVDYCPRASRLTIVDDKLVVQVRQAIEPLQRFWAAHEIAHFLLATRVGISFQQQSENPWYETFCNSFASHLLLPGDWLRAQARDELQSLLTVLRISATAKTSLLSSVAALNDRGAWDTVLVVWASDGSDGWLASSVVGDSGCGLIASAEDTDNYLSGLDGGRASMLRLPIQIDGQRRQVRAEAIRWRSRCYSLFQRRLLVS